MIIAMLVIIFLVGWLIHVLLYPTIYEDDNYSPRIARLTAYVIGMGMDIPLSWLIVWAYNRQHKDRRKKAYPFERYVLVRFLAAAALGLGVLLGYMLDKE